MPDTIETKQLTTADLANAANGRNRQDFDRRSSRSLDRRTISIRGLYFRRIFGGYADPMGDDSDRLRG